MNYIAWSCLVAEVFPEDLDVVCHRRPRSCGEFDLDGNQLFPDIHHDIALRSRRGPPEIDLRLISAA